MGPASTSLNPLASWNEADNRYHLSLLAAGPSPILRMTHQPLLLSSSTETDTKSTDSVIVFTDLPADNIHWLPEGMVYEELDGSTRLCRISGYRWIKSVPVDHEMDVEM
jgi:hypothetical protein